MANKEIFQVTWIVTSYKPKYESHRVTTELMTKYQAIRRMFQMMDLPKSKTTSISSLAILKKGIDVTSNINKWLASSKVN